MTRRTAFVALLVLTAACGDSRGAAAQGGQFTADITGAATATLEGFAPSSARPGVAWTLQMETPGGENVIMIVREGAGRPDPGAYDLLDFRTHSGRAAAGGLVTSVQLHDSILPGDGFDTVRGTLNVTASSDTSVEGEFTLTAHHSRDPARAITVSGTFRSHNRAM